MPTWFPLLLVPNYCTQRSSWKSFRNYRPLKLVLSYSIETCTPIIFLIYAPYNRNNKQNIGWCSWTVETVILSMYNIMSLCSNSVYKTRCRGDVHSALIPRDAGCWLQSLTTCSSRIHNANTYKVCPLNLNLPNVPWVVAETNLQFFLHRHSHRCTHISWKVN